LPYERVFGARVTVDLVEEGLRHAFIEIGPHTVLHPFQVPGIVPPTEPQTMFRRGRLDHFALNAASEASFRELRRRVLAEGVRRRRMASSCRSTTVSKSLKKIVRPKPQGRELENPPKHHVTEREEHEASSGA
jgi:catechol 2,3-dioxygenase-like lactoylglutathione lyase family enzyme